MQISSQFRKPSSPLKQTHPKYITSPLCVPIGCTGQGVGSLHSLDTTLHPLQHTYCQPSIHTTQNFKWPRYTLTTLNLSQLQTCIYKHSIPKGKMHSNCMLLPDLIQANILLLSNCKDTGEEPSSIHNRKHTKHTHATRVQNTTLYSDGTTHTKYHRRKWVLTKWRTITVALDMSKAFYTINIHTLIRKLLQTTIPGTIIKFIASYIKGHNI